MLIKRKKEIQEREGSPNCFFCAGTVHSLFSYTSLLSFLRESREGCHRLIVEPPRRRCCWRPAPAMTIAASLFPLFLVMVELLRQTE
ncbi:hypothetical protein STCU_10936 [Strigomonas culicis]|uniref:Uncharacterized protein n=1 Tax=Strigomonas culicis TaxID=28005 RepID=S9TKK1_9TRYP|nr:hypothetical protein STCU_10936 [Strigomonas culicis]|eukprot:EPY16863.1 hypothetical protein STCU_10936 [Strigomonas culicis]